jgi:hypothetical protein
MDLRGPDDVGAAFRRLTERAAALPARLDGIYVQRIHAGGVELLISAFRDPVFGPMIACGHGGGMTELVDDICIHRAPVDAGMAAAMLRRLRLVRWAQGGNAALELLHPATFIAAFSEFAAGVPFRRFTFEVNPIKWTSDGVIAVDGLLIVEER